MHVEDKVITQRDVEQLLSEVSRLLHVDLARPPVSLQQSPGQGGNRRRELKLIHDPLLLLTR